MTGREGFPGSAEERGSSFTSFQPVSREKGQVPRSEEEKKIWSADDVFLLLEGNSPKLPEGGKWTSLHTHTQESVTNTQSQEYTQAVADFVELYDKLGVEQVGKVEHGTKAYPEEQVIPWSAANIADMIARGETTAEELGIDQDTFDRWKNEVEDAFRMVYADEIKTMDAYNRWKENHWNFGGNISKAIEAGMLSELWDHTRRNLYHEVADLAESEKLFAEQAKGRELNPVVGLEVDTVAKETDQGIQVDFAPSLDQIGENLGLDYVILSMHPGTKGLSEELVADPDKLTKLYLSAIETYRRTVPEELAEKPFILGHPFRRMSGFEKMSKEQKQAIISAGVKNNCVFEISVNDLYLYLYKDGQRRQGRELSPRGGLFDRMKEDPGAIQESPAIKEFKEKVATFDDEFLELLIESDAQLSFDTDLHAVDLLSGWRNQAQKFAGGESVSTEDQDTYQALENYAQLSNLLERGVGTDYRDLPHRSRKAVFRFVRALQYLLNKGAKPENIINFKNFSEQAAV